VLDEVALVFYNTAVMSRSATATLSGEVPSGAIELGTSRLRLRMLPGGSQRPPGDTASNPQTARLISTSGRPLRILIVDDDPAVSATLEEMITEAGAESVGVITSALAAIGAAAVISPDVVLMDVRLPGAMDGVEAASVIRARGSAAVVIITGAVSDPEVHARLRTHDGFEVVFKPVLQDELIEAIRRAYVAR
jgi:CheY-like chemotaxis protein